MLYKGLPVSEPYKLNILGTIVDPSVVHDTFNHIDPDLSCSVVELQGGAEVYFKDSPADPVSMFAKRECIALSPSLRNIVTRSSHSQRQTGHVDADRVRTSLLRSP